MNRPALKKYALQARKDFIAAVTRRAEKLGLNPKSPAKVKQDGDVLLINGQAFPSGIARQRQELLSRIEANGFEQTMDAMAYTWFNRLVAIRYMELHGFLDHGFRVLSHPANQATGHTQPEILDHIAELDLPGLDRSRALDLKLAGNRDEALYREVLLAQCHALHKAMPFLFESLDDATELLLPDGLLRTDSILGKLVTAIDEADWQDVEIIGWLYQFYISEKKDQVIGKVVKSEDIPAATQLFTPNWIVKYLVQNSLGRLWLMANPTSTLATKWEYYIKPAEQTAEVNAQLDALIQARIEENGATLNPESLTLLDPACGSGHILVEAYDLLRDIYLERGYRRQDIPRLILEKNLYGLDIDDRAAQLAGFALLMKARADDRRLFGQPVALNVLALQEAKVGSAAELHSALNAPQIDYSIVNQLVESFEQAKTFGSLIQIHDELASALPDLRRELEPVRDGSDMLGRDAAETLLGLVAQAEVLAKAFDAVAANPPYMGRKYLNSDLRQLAESTFPECTADIYAMFIARANAFCRLDGSVAMITMDSWMYGEDFFGARSWYLNHYSLLSLCHLGPHAFPEVKGEVVQAAAFSALKRTGIETAANFYDLVDIPSSDDKASALLNRSDLYTVDTARFSEIPRSVITAYRLSRPAQRTLENSIPMRELAEPFTGLQTGDNERFIRYWFEISEQSFWRPEDAGTESNSKWTPYVKGSDYRKWFGNNLCVIDWRNNGEAIRSHKSSTVRNADKYFSSGLAYNNISKNFCARFVPSGFIFDQKNSMFFSASDDELLLALGVLQSSAITPFLNVFTPKDFGPGALKQLPVPRNLLKEHRTQTLVRTLIDAHRADWDACELSWDFAEPALLRNDDATENSVRSKYENWRAEARNTVNEVLGMQSELDALILEAYGLSDEVEPKSELIGVTLNSNPVARYGDGNSQLELEVRLRKDCSLELVSYAIGCMMGRYSLDAPGLIYAHAGNEGFDPSRYETFPADDDGIVPITDEAWFDDDGSNRIREFVRVVWGEETEAENMAWLAEALGSKASESADDTIRRYLSRDFYKDHLQTYKKRPIYWLFSSGKHKAFEALVYLHRYNAGTLSRMRMEYVVPLQSRMQSRIDSLEQDIHAAATSAETKRLQKQRDKLTKQLDELRRYDESLRHYADQRITLDLDDGVKVNYGKFGDLLAEVKAVTGKNPKTA
ncbi:BREX-1 system adenine-specific DNA-methyltransferase PglX [Spectribacter hydrogenoxidans]|uniref:site-specific DNA-methyltransferase (adenine-specific) n=1 Tax=Spectribacter hydrogenoxidans TaxID=3075608 RepID=A0ABU3C4B0_9GAMM|nr:BREX-1 system adenine-specific DNA-methyltransferase PglX [Salinisphaera sp. W335]MDT0636383.1 BREX-1 system adenine-specific DNA-methyltransferase PglX [Salinisphaera sp. W335]